MKKRQKSDADFWNQWLYCKIEILRRIERLCAAIMSIVASGSKPEKDYSREEEPNSDNEIGQAHPHAMQAYWEAVWDKLSRGEQIAEYKDFRDWFDIHRGGGFVIRLLFNEVWPNDDSDISENPLCIEVAPYGVGLNSLQSIKDDCSILAKLFEQEGAKYGGQDIIDIEATVNGIIQSTYMLIGQRDEEYHITDGLKKMNQTRMDKVHESQRITKRKIQQAVLSAFTSIVNKNNKETLLNMSERQFLKMVRTETGNVKTVVGKEKSPSLDTIKSILRERDKKKYSFYPWDKQ